MDSRRFASLLAPFDLEATPPRPGAVIVAVDPNYYRPTEVETLLGDPAKARRELGWVPKISFDQMVAEMVRADLKQAARDFLIQKSGFEVPQRMDQ